MANEKVKWPAWTPAATPPDDEELKIVWLKEGWMAFDNYVGGEWQSFGDGMIEKWMPSPPVN
jgi:hypothetical protein